MKVGEKLELFHKISVRVSSSAAGSELVATAEKSQANEVAAMTAARESRKLGENAKSVSLLEHGECELPFV